MQLLRWSKAKPQNHRARHKTRASLLSDKGLDAANHNPRFRRREKNVLDIPSYRTGVAVEKLTPEKFAEIGLRQDALQTTFSVRLDIFIPEVLADF